jgi:lysophospholipase L1-like esterase
MEGNPTKGDLLLGGPLEVSNALGGNLSETEINQILNDRQDYRAVEETAATESQSKSTEQERERETATRTASQTAGPAGSYLGLVPAAIYSVIDNPGRYSAEKLEQKAIAAATKSVKTAEKAAKKTKKNLTEEERKALYDKEKMEFHENYVTYHEKRARELIKDPKTNNPLLRKALFYKDAMAAIAKAEEEAQGDESRQFSPSGPVSPANKALIGGGQPMSNVSSVARPNIPSTPNNAPPRQNQRRSGANPLNQLSNDLSSLKNAVNIARSIWASPALGVFIFIIALCGFVGIISGLLGGVGGGATGGGNPPVGGQSTYAFVALGDSLTAWPNLPAGSSPANGCAATNSCNGGGPPWPTALANEDSSLKLIENAGHPGYTTTQILSVFETELKSSSYTLPDVLFLQGGTNDTSSINTIGNLQRIITDAKTAGIKYVILLTITHQCSGTTNESQSSLNTPIKGLASSYVTVIDVANILSCSSTPLEYQPDGIHYTAVGAQKIADYIDSQIKARNILPTAPPAGNFHLYCQYAYQTAACDIYHDGCAPTSMAMVLTTFGDTTSPIDVGTKYGMGCTGSTSYQQIKDALYSLRPGYAIAVIGPQNNNLSSDTLKTYLGKGYYIIAGGCMTGGYSGTTGHTTVITSPNTDGTFNDADPTWNSPPSHDCSTDANVHMRTLNITYPGPDLPTGNTCGNKTEEPWGGWSWAFAVKKQ